MKTAILLLIPCLTLSSPTASLPEGGSASVRCPGEDEPWLIAHQDEDGRWDADGFAKHDPEGQKPDGAGRADYDVAVTGLVVFGLLGDGMSLDSGVFQESGQRAVAWLLAQQKPETGIIGDAEGEALLHGHALATLALCEAHYFSPDYGLEPACRRAVRAILDQRDPGGAWGVDGAKPRDSAIVSGWMLLALLSARDCGFPIEEGAFERALGWLEGLSEGEDGLAAPSAVALLVRMLLTQGQEKDPACVPHAEVLLRNLPVWDPGDPDLCFDTWCFGSLAMYQMGGSRYWGPWNKAMKRAILDSQRRDGAYLGVWDPIGARGEIGGRVYSTAVMTVCLQVYFRYAKVIGAR